jgi:hypothetical protein
MYDAMYSVRDKNIREAQFAIKLDKPKDKEGRKLFKAYLRALNEIFNEALAKRPIYLPNRAARSSNAWLSVARLDFQFDHRDEDFPDEWYLQIRIQCHGGFQTQEWLLVKEVLIPKKINYTDWEMDEYQQRPRKIFLGPKAPGTPFVFHSDILFALSDLRGDYDEEPGVPDTPEAGQTRQRQVQYVFDMIHELEWNDKFEAKYHFVVAQYYYLWFLLVDEHYSPDTPWNPELEEENPAMAQRLRRWYRAAYDVHDLPAVHGYGHYALHAFLLGNMPDDSKTSVYHKAGFLFLEFHNDERPIVPSVAYCATDTQDATSFYVDYAASFTGAYKSNNVPEFKAVADEMKTSLECTPMHALIAILMRYSGGTRHDYLNLANAGREAGFLAYTNAGYSNDAAVYAGAPKSGLLWPLKIHMVSESVNQIDLWFKMRNRGNLQWNLMKPQPDWTEPRAIRELNPELSNPTIFELERQITRLRNGDKIPHRMTLMGYTDRAEAIRVLESDVARIKQEMRGGVDGLVDEIHAAFAAADPEDEDDDTKEEEDEEEEEEEDPEAADFREYLESEAYTRQLAEFNALDPMCLIQFPGGQKFPRNEVIEAAGYLRHRGSKVMCRLTEYIFTPAGGQAAADLAALEAWEMSESPDVVLFPSGVAVHREDVTLVDTTVYHKTMDKIFCRISQATIMPWNRVIRADGQAMRKWNQRMKTEEGKLDIIVLPKHGNRYRRAQLKVIDYIVYFWTNDPNEKDKNGDFAYIRECVCESEYRNGKYETVAIV